MGSREEMDTENPKPPSAKWHVHRLVPAADTAAQGLPCICSKHRRHEDCIADDNYRSSYRCPCLPFVPAADNHVIWVDEINDFIPTIPPNIILGEE